MSEEKLLVKIQQAMDNEEAFFKEQDQKIIRQLREKACQEANEKYCEEHRNHCFRCGTKSLVEVERGNIKIDICVNEGCGAIHLDPGEIEQIMKNEKSIFSIRRTLLAVFQA